MFALGGDVGCGTVYEMMPPTIPGGAWTETVIYSFEGGSDGYVPMGNLVFDGAGNLYGTTYFGGGSGTCDQGIYPYCGTVFELSPPKTKGGAWTEKVLYSFKSGADGANPNGNLVFDKKGALYGTTYFGGNQGCPQDAGVGCGTVFRLSPPVKKGHPWGYEVLYRFNNAPQQARGDGENPAAGLVFDRKGTLYGTTLRGSLAEGTVFTLTPPKKRGEPWDEILLHFFGISHDDGRNPVGLVLDRKGNLYGPAIIGGAHGNGEIFRLRPAKAGKPLVYTMLYSFMPQPDAFEPMGYLTFDRSDNLYGVTQYGGTGPCQPAGCGAVFEFTP
jgi:uncharacterized repeat protein (TIGR03803 family)